ncbi:MAG: hypothetical protein KAR21_04440 [Spirochaetales bacterium]|nr:hypothetical protein [Spirochaetales bacterium]
MPGSYTRLDGIIGTLLGSKDVKLHGRRSINRAVGIPVDEKRVELFWLLANHLETIYYPDNPDINQGNKEHFENKAFFETFVPIFILPT